MAAPRPAPTAVPLVADLRVDPAGGAGPVRELASGIDSLYLSARATLGPTFLERLEDHRRWADRVRVATPFQIGTELFAMAPHASGRYRFCLEHKVARIGLTTSEHLPSVRVQPRAESLHSLGPAGTAAAVSELLSPELGRLFWTVSRVDNFCDFQGVELTAADAGRFVCRADARTTFEMAGKFTGFTFGSRRSKTLTARLYDKTADVEAKGATWWYELWGDAYDAYDAYDASAPVWRLEFEVAREALAQFGLSGVEGPRRSRRHLGVRGRRVAHAQGSPGRRRQPLALAACVRVAPGPAGEPPAAPHRRRAHRRRPTRRVGRSAAARPHRLPGLARGGRRHPGRRRHHGGCNAAPPRLRASEPDHVRRARRAQACRDGTPVTTAPDGQLSEQGDLLGLLNRVIDARIDARLAAFEEHLGAAIARQVVDMLRSDDRMVAAGGRPLLTVPEAAKLLPVSRSTVYELMNAEICPQSRSAVLGGSHRTRSRRSERR